jgi:glutamine amidotransferase
MKIRNRVRILDYGVGNLHSVYRACRHFSDDVQVVENIREQDSISHLILPGVGAFGIAMDRINDAGLSEQIIHFVESGKPVLGICVGMQILTEVGFENGTHSGLSILKGKVVHLSELGFSNYLRIPNMGWSMVSQLNQDLETELFRGLHETFYAYFAHSYAAEIDSLKIVTSYLDAPLKKITASIQSENVFGVQFHPEKSGLVGLRIVENFLRIES